MVVDAFSVELERVEVSNPFTRDRRIWDCASSRLGDWYLVQGPIFLLRLIQNAV